MVPVDGRGHALPRQLQAPPPSATTTPVLRLERRERRRRMAIPRALPARRRVRCAGGAKLSGSFAAGSLDAQEDEGADAGGSSHSEESARGASAGCAGGAICCRSSKLMRGNARVSPPNAGCSSHGDGSAGAAGVRLGCGSGRRRGRLLQVVEAHAREGAGLASERRWLFVPRRWLRCRWRSRWCGRRGALSRRAGDPQSSWRGKRAFRPQTRAAVRPTGRPLPGLEERLRLHSAVAVRPRATARRGGGGRCGRWRWCLSGAAQIVEAHSRKPRVSPLNDSAAGVSKGISAGAAAGGGGAAEKMSVSWGWNAAGSGAGANPGKTKGRR